MVRKKRVRSEGVRKAEERRMFELSVSPTRVLIPLLKNLHGETINIAPSAILDSEA